MSKIGKKPILIPENVTVQINGNEVVVKGPKGEIKKIFDFSLVEPKIVQNQIIVTPKKQTGQTKARWGLIRSLLANMVQGVVEGFSKALEIHGTGYRASLEGKNLKILVGFSHPVVVTPPEGINFSVEENNLIKVSGIDKELVGQVAAKIRGIKKADPYKGKGLRYQGEVVRKKAGKAAKAGAAAGG